MITTLDELHAFCKSVSLPSRFGFGEVMAFEDGDEVGVIIDLRVPEKDIPEAFTEISNSFRFTLPVERGYVEELIRIKSLDLICHEVSEWILIGGVAVFDPHAEKPPMSYEEMCKVLVENSTGRHWCEGCRTGHARSA